MLLLFSMTTFLGNSYSSSLFCVSFLNIFFNLCVSVCALFLFDFEGGMLALIVLVPDYCFVFTL